MFKVGALYTKNDIYRILDVPAENRKGAWDTGYNLYDGAVYIFVNIQTKGRSGQDHANYWDGHLLHWEAKGNARIHQSLIGKIVDDETPKHFFTRTDNKAPFTYEGLGYVVQYYDEHPIKVIWDFTKYNDRDEVQVEISKPVFLEGSKYTITFNKHERNPVARRICINEYGCVCKICGFDYERFYGAYAKDYIQVHHIIPISEIGEEYEIDPLKDLMPICGNCHSIIHRKRIALRPEELVEMLKKHD